MAELALNYSELAARLVRAGAIRIDRFKCPAWPDLVATAARKSRARQANTLS